MYTRSYADHEISIPEKYGGTMLEEIEKAKACEAHSNDHQENIKHDPISTTEFPILRDILNWVGISGGKTGIEWLIPKIGYEEMLIIGLATLLFFCSNPDRECAMILLALIFIK